MKYFLLIPLILTIGIIPILPNIDAEEQSIPSWIKTTAEFWVNGDVTDQEFVDALQHLVKLNVLSIPQSENILSSGQSISSSSMKPCTRDYRPVCGLDSVTYSNMCVLENNDAVFSHHGQCVGEKETGSVLFRNVNLFDGTSDTLQQNMNVLVEGNLIKQISKNDIRIEHNTPVIEAHGKTLMPGLLDAHTHLSHIESNPIWGFDNREWTYQGATMGKDAELMLMRGFTTVRDTGGATTGLQKAIDDGRVVGPRILSSGAYISMTSGHGDFGGINQISPGLTGQITTYGLWGQGYVVDGEDAILSAVRQNMRMGASQIKMMADGGISSHHDPLGVNQFSPKELRAGVEEAERWGTYVLVHAFTDEAILHAIEAGVKVIDHGPMMTEETVKIMKEKGIWFSTQFRAGASNPDEFALEGPSVAKFEELQRNKDIMIAAIQKHDLIPAFGSDFFGSYEKATLQSEEFQARIDAGYTSPEVMIQATSHTAKMFELAGERHPYREGSLGVIEQGAYADILIIDGNPLEDASVLGDYEHNIKLIMKDGVIYKNTLN